MPSKKQAVSIILCLLTLAAVALVEPTRAEPARAKPTEPHVQPATWPFFAFDNGVGRGQWTPEEQAELLAELDYDGLGYTGIENIAAVAETFEARGLKLFSTYLAIQLDEGKDPYEPGLPDAIRSLRGHDTVLWLHVHGKRTPPEALDSRAVRVIREVADLAEASDLRVALYPHTGFYVATNEDALRLVPKIDRKNVGTSFNLCHFLKQHDERLLESQLKAAAPHLFLVSINGADSGDTPSMGWNQLIQTLDRGTFPMARVLTILQEVDYKGPIGLQCYNVRGDTRENLTRSIQAWKTLRAE